MTTYLLLLLGTILLEVPFALALAPRAHRGTVVATAICANLLTHPVATWLQIAGVPFALVEAAVVAAEALCYRRVARLRRGRAATIALLANAVTIGVACALAA